VNRLRDSKFLRYFTFGAMAATLQVATLTILVEVVLLDKVIASIAAFYFAVVVNYFLQSQYTFRSVEPHWIAMPKFISFSTIGAGVNALIFFLLIKVIHYVLAQCVALLIVFILNYGVSKTLVFRRQAHQRASE
jgi:putative flippase GtrA